MGFYNKNCVLKYLSYVSTVVLVTGAVLIGTYIIYGGPSTEKKSGKKLKGKIQGLINIGNSCFLNCILQALASCPSFMNWLIRRCQDAKPPLISSLNDVVLELNGNSEGSETSAHGVLQALRYYGWVISPEEQDAHELFHALTSTIDDEITLLGRQYNSLLNISWMEDDKELQPSESFHSCPETNVSRDNLDCNKEMDNERKDLDFSKETDALRGNIYYNKEMNTETENVNYNKETSTAIESIDSNNSNSTRDHIDLHKETNTEKGYLNFNKETNTEREYLDFNKGANTATENIDSIESNAAIDIDYNNEKVEDESFSFSQSSEPNTSFRSFYRRSNSHSLVISKYSASTRNLATQSSLSESPFKGHLASQLQCCVCGYKNIIKWSTFDSLSLSLPSTSSVSSSIFLRSSLQQLLNDFVRKEFVTDVSCDGCTEIRGSPMQTTFSKQLTIAKLPDCLCFHIQRNVWQDNGVVSKRKDFVSIPEVLDMTPYTFATKFKSQNNISNGRASYSIGNLQSKARALTTDSINSSDEDGGGRVFGALKRHCLYRLQSVVVHVGDAFSGHFVTYRRGPLTSSNSWFYTSDTIVKQVSPEEVFQSNAYMVIYQKLSL